MVTTQKEKILLVEEGKQLNTSACIPLRFVGLKNKDWHLKLKFATLKNEYSVDPGKQNSSSCESKCKEKLSFRYIGRKA